MADITRAGTAQIEDGGPAFPRPATEHDEGWTGMTLRDYFAAKAMAAQVIADMVPGPACDALVDAAARAGQDRVYRLALNSYEIADAMLAARKEA